MYTAEKAAIAGDSWDISDPDGDYVCTVVGRGGVEALLSHLNRIPS